MSTDANFTFYFALAFARDGNRDGVFTPYWDDTISPDLIQQLQQENPNRRFIASLGGGDNFPWQAPSDESAWVDNAVASLTAMKNTYHLDGFDIDYEGNTTDPSFVSVLSQLMQKMNGFPTFPPPTSVNFSLAPYGNNLPEYFALYQNNTTYISQFNYQAYADNLGNLQSYVDLYAQLDQENPDQGPTGYSNLGLGIDSNTTNARGLGPPVIFDIWNQLHSQGLGTAVIWSVEDSAKNNFVIEQGIQARG